MNFEDPLKEILILLEKNEINPDNARKMIEELSIRRLGEMAKIDTLRKNRSGVHEVVFAENKKSEDVARILLKLAADNRIALATRIKQEDVEAVQRSITDDYLVEVNEQAGTILLRHKDYEQKREGLIGILAAGTADIPVAEESRVTAEFIGCETIISYDVGVAGIHRLFEPIEKMRSSNVDAIIAVAGMEGALPSVVAGLVDVPVIGVPTSVGYGIGGKGTAALLAMLQSCSPGLAVVNVDNGFGAGVFASLISKKVHCRR